MFSVTYNIIELSPNQKSVIKYHPKGNQTRIRFISLYRDDALDTRIKYIFGVLFLYLDFRNCKMMLQFLLKLLIISPKKLTCLKFLAVWLCSYSFLPVFHRFFQESLLCLRNRNICLFEIFFFVLKCYFNCFKWI